MSLNLLNLSGHSPMKCCLPGSVRHIPMSHLQHMVGEDTYSGLELESGVCQVSRLSAHSLQHIRRIPLPLTALTPASFALFER